MTETSTPSEPKEITTSDLKIGVSYYARAKMGWLCEKANHEVGFMCVLDDHPIYPFYVVDVRVPAQKSSHTEVDWTPEGLGAYHFEMGKSGLPFWKFGQVQGHTHPASVTGPSGTDDTNFRKYQYPWQIMLILRKHAGPSDNESLWAGRRLKLVVPIGKMRLVMQYDLPVVVDEATIVADMARIAHPDTLEAWAKELANVTVDAPDLTGLRCYGPYDDDFLHSTFERYRDRVTGGRHTYKFDSESGTLVDSKGNPLNRRKATKKEKEDKKTGRAFPKSPITEGLWFQEADELFGTIDYNPSDFRADPITETRHLTKNGMPARARRSLTFERLDADDGWIPCPATMVFTRRECDATPKSRWTSASFEDSLLADKIGRAIAELARSHDNHPILSKLSKEDAAHILCGGYLTSHNGYYVSYEHLDQCSVLPSGHLVYVKPTDPINTIDSTVESSPLTSDSGV